MHRPRLGGARWLGRIAGVLLAAVLVGVSASAALLVVAQSRWADDRLADVVRRELARRGLVARFRLRVEPPFGLVLEDVQIVGSGDPAPRLDARRVVVRPRVRSLLLGRLEAQSIELRGPRLRMTLAGAGPPRGLAPEAIGAIGARWPVRHVVVDDGEADVEWGRVHLWARGIDLNAEAPQSGGAVRAGVRAGGVEAAFADGVHADALCALELRARVARREIAVDALEARAVADGAKAPAGAAPASCGGPEDDPRRIHVRVSGATASFDQGLRFTGARGRAEVRAPLGVLARLGAAGAVSGTGRVELDVHAGPGLARTRARGRIELFDVRAGRIAVARKVVAPLALDGGVVRSSRAEVETAAGHVELSGFELRPSVAGWPLRVDVQSGPLRFSEVLRAIGVSRHPHVEWTIDAVRVRGLAGTLAPLRVSGELVAATRDFAVFDAACDVERCRRIWGARSATIAARTTWTASSLELTAVRAELPAGAADVGRVVIG
ncbi:MAG TPA: hypothetical protein VE987_05995, partial [Polyangiaceae bacterium]|nr:hypothetical protein [Polyangiaceae bacterium]